MPSTTPVPVHPPAPRALGLRRLRPVVLALAVAVTTVLAVGALPARSVTLDVSAGGGHSVRLAASPPTFRGPWWLATKRSSVLRALVTDGAGAPLAGQSVRFTLGAAVVTGTTGGDGVASGALVPTASGRKALLLEVLAGTTVVASSSVTVTVLAPGKSAPVAGLGATGPWATSQSQVIPVGVAGRGGVVYLLDRVSNSVLKVDTVASPGSATVVVPSSELGPLPAPSGFSNDPVVGLAVDAAGRVVVADPGGHRVRRWDPTTGAVTTIAGSGTPGFGGDGGPATAALLAAPRGVAVDASGRVLVADTGNARVRRIAADGTISTVLGTGAAGAAGSALSSPISVAVPSGDVVAALDEGPNAVVELTTGGVRRTPYTGSFSSLLRGLATDATGALLVSEDLKVTRVSGGAATTVLSTTFGSATSPRPGEGSAPGAALGALTAIGWDGTSLLFVQHAGWSTVRRVSSFGSGTATVSTVVGSSAAGFTGTEGARATSVLLGEPAGVGVDADGATYLMDPRAYRAFRVPTDGAITRWAGDPASQAVICPNSSSSGFLSRLSQLFCAPTDLSTDQAGRLTLTDTGHGQVLLAQQGLGSTLTLLAGTPSVTSNTGEGVAAAQASLQGAQGSLWDPSGQLVVVDTPRNRVRRVSGGVVTTFVGSGVAGYAGDGGPAGAAQLRRPTDGTYDAAGNLYLADTGNHVVRRVAAGTGIITTVAGTGTAGFSGDGALATAAGLSSPTDVLVVGRSLLVADRGNHRVRMVDLVSGRISTVMGTGGTTVTGVGGRAVTTGLPWPTRLATDGGGSVLVSSQRGGAVVEGLGFGWPSGWTNGAGTGAVLRFTLPRGR